jgi:hypothetical protein
MQQDQLDRFKRWFEEFAGRFYGDDRYVNANLAMKQEHTQRTCIEMRLLAEHLALNESQTRIAEVIALLHDVGRFPQFVTYRTYNDARSVNHGQLGVQVLRDEGVLETLRREERRWVETAVGLHGRRTLPTRLTGQALLLTKMIRDADKLDIFRVVIDKYRRYCEDPENFLIEVELPDEPTYSTEVIEAVLDERSIDYSRLRTLNDAKLCQLGWVYDMNFAASLARLRRLGFLDRVLSFLPETAEMARVRDKILGYVESRLGQACT